MPHRPLRPRLVLVALLALCDYLLWNWSLSANHDILALVSGMTLIPLLIALAWLLVLAATRLLSRLAQRSGALSAAGSPVGSRTRAGDAAGSRTGAGGAGGLDRGDGSGALGGPAGSAAGAGGGPGAGAVAGEARTAASSSKLAA